MNSRGLRGYLVTIGIGLYDRHCLQDIVAYLEDNDYTFDLSPSSVKLSCVTRISEATGTLRLTHRSCRYVKHNDTG